MASWYFSFLVFGQVKRHFPFVSIIAMPVLANNILQYSLLVTFLRQFLYYHHALNDRNWFPYEMGQVHFLGIEICLIWQRPSISVPSFFVVWVELRFPLQIQQYDPETVLPHPGFFLPFLPALLLNQRLMTFCTLFFIDSVNWRNSLTWPCFLSWLQERQIVGSLVYKALSLFPFQMINVTGVNSSTLMLLLSLNLPLLYFSFEFYALLLSH